MIPVTKPYLPILNNYINYLSRAYELEWLTNRGTLVKELEERISLFLGSKNIPLLMNNGTVPLQIAVKHLPENCEIITTPFSYIATTTSILWENRKPIFADIEEDYLCINPLEIRKKITPKTRAILATHVFGNPCDIEEVSKIACEFGLFVIYDAAHCFGVKYNGKSIFDYGDISTCSFHATKLFHTGEGGAAFVNKTDLYDSVFQMHNFGHDGPYDYALAGINGKISELNAAMGHAVLDDFNLILNRRKEVCDLYNNHLKFSTYKRIKIRNNTDWNFSYYPIVFQDEKRLLKVVDVLNNNDIYPRRYFYPSINTIPFIKSNTVNPISEDISKRILCLPIYHTLTVESQLRTIELINHNLE